MTRKYLIYLAPQFSMMSLLPLTEVLRKANELAAAPLYSYEFVAMQDRVEAVNDMAVETRSDLPRDKDLAGVMICSSYQFQTDDDRAVHGWLRWCARHGVPIGVTDTGAFIAAQAGLDWPTPICVHWLSRAAFQERHDTFVTSDGLFEYTPQRMSCVGAAAGLDLMLHMVAEHHGQSFAARVGSHLVFGRREIAAPERKSHLAEFIAQAKDPILQTLLTEMESSSGPRRNLEFFADQVGLTVQQMNRLFKKHLSKTPARVYQQSRLRRAEGLIRSSALPIETIAEECGFASRSQFHRAYRAEFGLSPSEARGTWDRA